MRQLALLLIALCLTLHATADRRPISFDEAVERMMQHNPAIEAARQAVEVADHERRAAKGLYAPEVGLMGGYTHLERSVGINANGLKGTLSELIPTPLLPTIEGLLTPVMQADWRLTLQKRDVAVAGGYITLPIWMGGRIHTANRAAALQKRLSEVQLQATRNRALTTLVNQYFGLSLAEQVVKVRHEAVVVLKKHLHDAEALEQEGIIARSERLYVAYKLAEAKRDAVEAELRVKTVEHALQTTLGLDSTTARFVPDTPLFILDRIPEKSFFQAAAAGANPLISQSDLAHQLAHEAVRAQRAEFFPEVVAVGGGAFYNYRLSELVPRWAVGVAVRFKLFDGLRREQRYRAAHLTEDRYKTVRREAQEGVSTLVEEHYNRLQAAHRRLLATDSALRFAERYLADQQLAFHEGVTTSSQLLDAELELSTMRIERLETAYHFVVALAELIETAGMSDQFGAYLHRADRRIIRFLID